MNDEEARIRELAHQIWESEGKPEGQQERHWEMARKLAAADQQPVLRPRTRARRITKPEPLTDSGTAVMTNGAATGNGAAQKKAAPRRSRSSSSSGDPGRDPATETLSNPRVGTRPEKPGGEIPGNRK